MARKNTRFKNAYNALLELIGSEKERVLVSEHALADRLGVSRTVVRSVLAELDERGVIEWNGREKRVVRNPRRSDRFPDGELTSDSERFERPFLEWTLHRGLAPGAKLNVSELARRFSVTPLVVTSFLARLGRFGLVDHTGRGGWRLRGFTSDYAIELSQFRTMIELDAAVRFAELPEDHAVWLELDRLEADHRALLAHIEDAYRDFSVLDDRFHTLITDITGNRFVREFQEVISLVFHYHYQWNRHSERQRNEAAIREHLAYIEALRSRDAERIRHCACTHLTTARRTLLASLKPY
ncbi:GntR family transcriptional regulator [Pararhizobium mangrovi]|uniref:GntR family transcriptional regulator n=1 Tax=Pararhizobium mangrovi TaxID=2590452 RepID=A0A506U1T7_9HYPH|nr:GntR family transcriptional regulator [Pararhizobium mangrovi]TPW27416.1 GntR family transcriptional regulator [Pararhizobium mangrovi]